jgi:hypothetical protein
MPRPKLQVGHMHISGISGMSSGLSITSSVPSAATGCLGLILISENRRRGVRPSCCLHSYSTNIWPCPQFNPSSLPSSAYFSYSFCYDSEGLLTMSGQCEFHEPVMTRRLTSKLLFQLPLWSILPFQPTFRCRFRDWTDCPTDSFYT